MSRLPHDLLTVRTRLEFRDPVIESTLHTQRLRSIVRGPAAQRAVGRDQRERPHERAGDTRAVGRDQRERPLPYIGSLVVHRESRPTGATPAVYRAFDSPPLGRDQRERPIPISRLPTVHRWIATEGSDPERRANLAAPRAVSSPGCSTHVAWPTDHLCLDPGRPPRFFICLPPVPIPVRGAVLRENLGDFCTRNWVFSTGVGSELFWGSERTRNFPFSMLTSGPTVAWWSAIEPGPRRSAELLVIGADVARRYHYTLVRVVRTE